VDLAEPLRAGCRPPDANALGVVLPIAIVSSGSGVIVRL
jgi:ribosomal protein S10